MPHRALTLCHRAAALPAALSLWMAAPSLAEMTFEHEGAVESISAGLFCLVSPDANGAEVGGTGRVNLYTNPFPFAVEGDRLTSQSGVGIGIVARLHPLLRDSILTARASHDAPGAGAEKSWLTRSRPDGQIWLGYVAGDVDDLDPGLWRFSLWRGPDEVFAYDITVLPAGAAPTDSCQAQTS